MVVYISDTLNDKKGGGASRSGYEFLLFLLMNYQDVIVVSNSKITEFPLVFYGMKVNVPRKQFVLKRQNRFRGFRPINLLKFCAKWLIDIFKSDSVSMVRHLTPGEPVHIFVNSFATFLDRVDFNNVNLVEKTCIVRGSPESFHYDNVPAVEAVNTAVNFLNRFSSLIYVSDICREKWAPLLKNTPKAFYLPNSIDEEEIINASLLDVQKLRKGYGFEEDCFHVILVGSLQRRKGQDFLYGVLDEMVQVCPNLQIHLIGVISDSEGGTQIKKLLCSHRFGEQLKFYGHRDDVLRLIRISDLAIFTSRAEAFPRAIAEYMALEKAIITTNVSGIPEMIHNGDNGFLFNVDDCEQFLKYFKLIVEDEFLRNSLGVKAKETYYSKFTKKLQIQKVLAIFEQIP